MDMTWNIYGERLYRNRIGIWNILEIQRVILMSLAIYQKRLNFSPLSGDGSKHHCFWKEKGGISCNMLHS